MKIRLLPSSVRDSARLHYLTSFVINDVVAIDAGCLGQWGTPADQARVRDVLLTHTHADHTGSLPVFIENVIDESRDGPNIWGEAATLASLRQDVFNDRIWPNFVDLTIGARRLLHLHTLEPERPVTVAGLTLTPISVNHPVPTVGYLVDDGEAAALFSGDTGPTARLWEIARACPRLRAVYLELSFPDERAELARRTGHLTPKSFAGELTKLARPDVAVYAFHLKPRFRSEIAAQLAALRLANVTIAELGREYDVSRSA